MVLGGAFVGHGRRTSDEAKNLINSRPAIIWNEVRTGYVRAAINVNFDSLTVLCMRGLPIDAARRAAQRRADVEQSAPRKADIVIPEHVEVGLGVILIVPLPDGL